MTPNIPFFLTRVQKSVCPILRDGNSFYRALALSEYKNMEFHRTIRYFATDQLQKSMLIPLFVKALAAETYQDGVWNPELAPTIHEIIPELLHIHLVVHDYDASRDVAAVYKYGNVTYPMVELLCSNKNHYDLIVST